MACPNCGAPNETGRKFCGECGTRLAQPCPSCGTPNTGGTRFCGECGTSLTGAASPEPGIGRAGTEPAPQTERRVVSILFADLVGFTTRAETQDPETVREFLARYFAVARETVERYGGAVEKFVGDAVMAVWGTPVALEDDAERAVRAAMDLIAAVRQLGREVGDEGLEVRAGVLTGEAAVTHGMTGQGSVAGDLVNTAARLQTAAPPGTVLVGEGTYRAANRAIAFEPAGEHELKGKVAPVPAWRALRVVAERGGLNRSEGIEAPFVGREDELRLLKDVLHATSRERRIRLVSVTGEAGVGKSRLAWEFLKYIDGVLEDIYWHQGRSPAIAEGATFWAVAEMVRRRAGLVEDADEVTTRAAVAEMLQEYVPDEDERLSLEPTLLSLLGVGGAVAGGRDELFAALRTLFERIALRGTTVLVFEDLQWADDGVIDFIEHLLDWSIGYPILVVTLARPELLDRKPDWGAGRRGLVALALGPLPEPAMRALLLGLVPDLNDHTLRRVLGRADGMPLYAVEIIRMLAAEGRLRESQSSYEVVGELGDLAVPDTLQSLIAARLDALDVRDRALLQNGSVLGHTFSVRALSALTGDAEEDLEKRLRALVRREVLQLETDPRSPERGQFGFTQALVREVAYSALSRRDRRVKHLAAARHFESLAEGETAGVLATHYVDAWSAAPEGPEADAIAGQARIALRAAADRAVGLGSNAQAVALLQRAMTVTPDEREQCELLARIGTVQREMGRYDDAMATLREALGRYRASGDRVGAANTTSEIASTLLAMGQAPAAEPILREAVEEFADMEGDAVLVRLQSMLARAFMAEEEEKAIQWADVALSNAERLDLVPIVAEALITKGSSLAYIGRWREGTGLLEIGRKLALEHGLYFAAGRAAVNLSGSYVETDPAASVAVAREGIALARRYGYQGLLLVILVNAVESSILLGELDWVDAEFASVRIDSLEPIDRASLQTGMSEIGALRGEDISETLSELRAYAASGDVGLRSGVAYAEAVVAMAQGRLEDAIERAAEAARLTALNAPVGFSTACAASIRLRDLEGARRHFEQLQSIGARGPALAVDVLRYAAGIAALEGRWPDAVNGYAEVWTRMRALRLRFSLAMSQLEYLTVAPAGDEGATQVARDARAGFESIGAAAFLPQLDALIAEREQREGDGDSHRVIATSPAHGVPRTQ